MSDFRNVEFKTTSSDVHLIYKSVKVAYDDDFLHVIGKTHHEMFALATLEWISIELNEGDKKDDRESGAAVLSFVRPDGSAH